MKTASLLILSVCHTITLIVAVIPNKTTTYNAAELLSKIFNSNTTIESRQRGYGFIKFEDQSDPGPDPDIQDSGQYGLIDNERPLRFEDDYDSQNNINDNQGQDFNENRPFKFENGQQNQNLALNNGGVSFQDDNKVDDQGNKKRKRRRRRKPKKGVLPHYPGVNGGLTQGNPGFQGPLQGGYGVSPYGNPVYPGVQPFRRPRRPKPKPSLATEALSSITEALTSIARYDDYQCVPRLLCEAAGGGALSDNGVLQSIAGIQPLLTLLSAYNGLSTSPLFVFGRAVFLGMTSKGNTGTCRYAYPQCPTDPEQLIYYLNNHNGGFFRFFNAPQLPNQNLEQFYNQLGQGYEYPPPPNYGYPNDQNPGQNNGFYDQNSYPRPYDGQDNGLNRPGPYDRPNLYDNQNYGSNYAYGYNDYGAGNQIRFKDSNARIEKRIQNKPTQNLADDSNEYDDAKIKWQFPHDSSENTNNNDHNIRDSRILKFPEENQSYDDQNGSKRKGKQSYFQQTQNNDNYYNDRQHIFPNNNRYETSTYSYNNRYEQSTHSYNNRYETSTYSYNNRYDTTTYAYSNGYNNQNYNNRRPYQNNNYKPPTKYHNHDYNPTNNNANYQNNQNYYNNRQNIYNNDYKYPTTTYNNEEYVFDHKHNFYVKKESNDYSNNQNNNHNKYSNTVNNNNDYNKYNHDYNNNNNKYNDYNKYNNVNNYKRLEDDGLKTVYVVRGNGDPNKPEIVKLRPGQSIY